ncbi:MAG TPA: AI-2E family transporter [Candidatus Limnocylindrales bacterium]|nr:AI-2E family transporter [Candidatus Limnocylindrales bacterium]
MATEDLAARQAYASGQWAAVRDRLRTVTPQSIGRAALTVAALGGAAWLTAASWPALLPFVIGGLLAYELLPVVDALDRVLPRALAALVAVLAALAVVVGIAVVVLPPLAQAFVRLATDLPTGAEVEAAIARMQERLAALPDGSAAVLIPVATTIAATVRDVFSGASGGLDQAIRAGLGALLSAIGALLGLIVLPTWMLGLMSEQRRAKIALNARITPGLRSDAWAVAAIVDRAAGAYLRGYVVTAFLVGFLTYVGLTVAPRVGGPGFHEPLALATLAGATQVVPIIGPFLGAAPALLILAIDPERAAAYFGIYLVARVLGATLLGSRVMQRRLGVHPAILVPGVVAIGQFGVLWLLLSAPIVAIAVDLVRYIHGRLSEPPLPAGVLPRTANSEAARARPVATVLHPVRSAYRAAMPPPPLATSTASQPATTSST